MSEETVCQTCGNRGFPEALNYCMTCGEAAEHTYCLEKLPEDLSEDISWTCESCMQTAVVELSQNPCDVPFSEGKGTDTYMYANARAPYSKRHKRKWCASNSTSPKTGWKNKSRSPCCMMDCADKTIQEKLAGQKKASGFRNLRR